MRARAFGLAELDRVQSTPQLEPERSGEPDPTWRRVSDAWAWRCPPCGRRWPYKVATCPGCSGPCEPVRPRRTRRRP